MKKVQKEVTHYITKYQANDGTIFNSEEECKNYEQTAEFAINQAYNKTFNVLNNKYEMVYPDRCEFACMCVESKLYAIKINSAEELKILNMMLDLNHADAVGAEYIGKEIVIDQADWAGEVYVYGTREDMISSFTHFVDSIKTFNIPQDA